MSRWVNNLLLYHFKKELLPETKKGLADYISRNAYQAEKSISRSDEKFLVAALSRLQTDAKLIQQAKHISAVQLNTFYLDNKPDQQIHTIKQLNQVLNTDSKTSVPLIQTFCHSLRKVLLQHELQYTTIISLVITQCKNIFLKKILHMPREIIIQISPPLIIPI